MENIVLWIASDGSDENTGTSQAPLATTEAALKRIRSGAYQEACIYYKSGKYLLNQPIILGKEDHDLHFEAEEGAKAEICGSFLVTGWKNEKINGIDMWVTDIEDKKDFRSLFTDEAVLPRSRWPKKDFFAVESVSEADTNFHEDPLLKMQSAMYVNTQDLLDFKNLTDVTIKILHYWKDETVNIKTMDTATGRIEFNRPATMTIDKGNRYYFENVWEALWEPGEWYFDRITKKLYYVPLPGQNIADAKIYAAQTEQLIVSDGAQNISFEGLAFTMTDWSIPVKTAYDCGADFHQAALDVTPAIYFENTQNISFTNCAFSKICSHSLKFGRNVQGITVKGNTFHDIGANAVFLMGENIDKEAPEVTRDFLITENLIERYGQRFFNGTAIAVCHARKGEVSNNDIHDGYMIAITVGWVWGYAYSVTSDVLVKGNHIYNVGQNLLSDMGAVYTLGVKEGVVITENIIHNVRANLKYGYGGWGIYMDEGSSNVMVTKNLVYDCNSTGFYQHFGRDNLVINNILAFCGEGQVSSYRNQPHVGFHLIRNIIVSNGSKFISMQDIIDQKIRSRFDESNNIYWDYQNGDQGIDVEWFTRELGLFHTATFTDPQFVDCQNRDFTLKENSPVFELGFIPWDISKAGRSK